MCIRDRFEMIPENFQSNNEFVLYKVDYIMCSLGNTTGITYKPLKIKSKQRIGNYRNKCKGRAIKKRERLRGMSLCDKLKINIRIIPVSYTHLDVYKRQDYNYSYFTHNFIQFPTSHSTYILAF